MSMLVRMVRDWPVVSFVLLAFAITWIAFIPFYQAGGEDIAWFTFGPFVAAIVISAILGGWPRVRALFASVVQWRVPPVWYLVAIGMPVAVQLLAIWINQMFGSAPPNWSNVPAITEIAVMVALLLVFSGPLGEEPGWRGFALPLLLGERGALNASLVLGLIWTAWHLPLVLLNDYSISSALNVMAAAVVFTWLYQNSAGSVLPAIMMHASHQNSVRYLGRVFEGSDAAQHQWIGLILWLVFALAIIAVYGTSSFRRSEATTVTG
ncbi:CPBP family intramembrane glutamic endopeptidase [Aminobacter aminovorans]|uniref:CPBP family intramembrane glutamic endopeptidase n=1 Tax=Aminobacter aminovorans TaxID=83263 RepID=UPI002861FE46|nr:CPBP family intramembrane glutamic endopeptidase [Aminobacter aminovorans]MDR7220174.1 membrane protease YdiL (CAAX protease family) [Aminobacter aminovorans]